MLREHRGEDDEVSWVAAKTTRKFWCTTASNHDSASSLGNALDHRFEPGVVDRAWAADIT